MDLWLEKLRMILFFFLIQNSDFIWWFSFPSLPLRATHLLSSSEQRKSTFCRDEINVINWLRKNDTYEFEYKKNFRDVSRHLSSVVFSSLSHCRRILLYFFFHFNRRLTFFYWVWRCHVEIFKNKILCDAFRRQFQFLILRINFAQLTQIPRRQIPMWNSTFSVRFDTRACEKANATDVLLLRVIPIRNFRIVLPLILDRKEFHVFYKVVQITCKEKEKKKTTID